MEDVVPTFRRAASVGRELGPPEVEDDADRDRVERRRHRKKEYSEKVVPRLRYVPFERRKRDKLGTVEQATQPFDFGSHAYELQGGSSHRMTKKGGGSAPPYDVLIKRQRESAAPVDDQQIAVDVRALLENGANPGLPKTSWPALAEILAVVQGPEMSRASVAIDAFAAAIHWVAEGNGSLEAAFVGTGAVYLGANKGGAAALRGNVASLPPQKRGPMAHEHAALRRDARAGRENRARHPRHIAVIERRRSSRKVEPDAGRSLSIASPESDDSGVSRDRDTPCRRASGGLLGMPTTALL
jgi:hypothetical protein